jgi:S1-C subfamily serine protease
MIMIMCYMTFFKSAPGDIAGNKTDAVVLIVADNLQNRDASSIGAGFFIGTNLIVTNAHVVDNADTISIQSYNNQHTFNATVIARNYTTDIALVKIDEWTDYTDTNSYKILNLVSSRDLSLGDDVWSVGHPWGLYWTVSHGIVSSTDRRIDESMMYYIQTDASTHQGNSGGPLMNSNGDVVGIVSKVYSLTRSDGFGLAIPSDIVIDSVEQLSNTGTVAWSTIGIDLSYTEDGKSVQVTKVLDWASTKNVDIRPGDILLEITTDETGLLGTRILSIQDYINELVVTDPGDEMILTLLRDGDIIHVTVITESVYIM